MARNQDKDNLKYLLQRIKMKDNILETKSKAIALEIIQLTRQIEKTNYVLANQVLRSGTSIGANICESTYAQSKADFISKLQIAQKEANETKYWLELLFESKAIQLEKYEQLYNKVVEMLKILAKSILTAKDN